jgi:hypothetical protein
LFLDRHPIRQLLEILTGSLILRIGPRFDLLVFIFFEPLIWISTVTPWYSVETGFFGVGGAGWAAARLIPARAQAAQTRDKKHLVLIGE